MKSLWLKSIVCIVVCLGLGIASGFVTAGEIQSWYINIEKPSWNPPNWLFGPVWTLLYILMGISVALVWHSDGNNKNAILLFVTQFVFNLCWSYIFFGMHAIGWAFAEIIGMWILIIATLIAFSKLNKISAYLLVPYLLWVTFAAVLNGTIWTLN